MTIIGCSDEELLAQLLAQGLSERAVLGNYGHWWIRTQRHGWVNARVGLRHRDALLSELGRQLPQDPHWDRGRNICYMPHGRHRMWRLYKHWCWEHQHHSNHLPS